MAQVTPPAELDWTAIVLAFFALLGGAGGIWAAIQAWIAYKANQPKVGAEAELIKAQALEKQALAEQIRGKTYEERIDMLVKRYDEDAEKRIGEIERLEKKLDELQRRVDEQDKLIAEILHEREALRKENEELKRQLDHERLRRIEETAALQKKYEETRAEYERLKADVEQIKSRSEESGL